MGSGVENTLTYRKKINGVALFPGDAIVSTWPSGPSPAPVSREQLRPPAADAQLLHDRGALVRLHLVRHRQGGPQERVRLRMALLTGIEPLTVPKHSSGSLTQPLSMK